MNARINKEIRTLLPAFALTVLAPLITLPLLAFWERDGVLSLGLFLSTMSCLAMGAALFGEEFNHRTMGLLLSQPISRQKIWREKMLVLGVAIALCFGAASLWGFFYVGNTMGSGDKQAAVITLFAFAFGIFCTVPYWTLSLKSMVGAVAFAVSTPAGLLTMMHVLADYYPQLKLPESQGGELYLVVLTLALYFGLFYWLGRGKFLHLQVVETQWQELKLPDQAERALAWPVKQFMSGRGGIWGNLISKELHLQRPGFVLAVLFGMLFPLEAMAWKLSKSETAIDTAVGFLAATFVIYFLLIPLITGGVCIAEERNWGMLGWQLTLPVAKRSQWFVKVSVALGTSLVLGVIFPITVFELCKWLFNLPLNPFTNPDSPLGNGSNKPGNLLCFLVYLILPCMAILASSLSTNTMKAVVMALVMTILAFSCIQPAVMAGEWVIPYFEIRSSWLRIHADWQVARLMISITVVLILGLILFFSFRSYVTGEVSSRRRWLQPLILLLSISGCLFALNLVIRSWSY